MNINKIVGCVAGLMAFGVVLGGCASEVDDVSGASDEGALASPAEEFRAEAGTAAVTEKGCGIPRTDVRGYISIGEGTWGNYAECYEFCPAGTFAYSIAQKSESTQGDGDDTALNGVKLECYNRSNGTYQGYVTSQVGPWGGNWLARAVPNPYSVANPIRGGRMKIEAPINGDDTAANALQLISVNNSVLTPNANTAWGTWNGYTYCPAGSAICGVNTRLEPSIDGDDTALNGVRFACCTF